MKMLIGCERSGRVREAFRKRGHDAYSNDLVKADDNSVYHIIGDVVEVARSTNWDAAIFHPPCTYLTVANVQSFHMCLYDQIEAIQFVEMLWFMLHIPKVAVENPVGVLSTRSMLGKPTQIVHPWMFGEGVSKGTCLWLRGFPKLIPTNVVDGRYDQTKYKSSGMINGQTRNDVRSITYESIANVMAEQWG